MASSENQQRPEVHTEADVDARLVIPYLTSLGIQPDQIRAQRSFTIRLGRAPVDVKRRNSVRGGRLDILVSRSDGRPLFIIEEKGPNEILTDEDRDQGISYARLVDPMAPLVLVTNGTDSHLYDTYTRQRLSDAASARLWRGDGRPTDDDSLRARAEALEHFVGLSAGNVATFSSAQRAVHMDALRGSGGTLARKYEPDLYVPRESVRACFSEFLNSTKTVFVLAGKSGFGKTNEMCSLAEISGAEHIALFFNGPELARSLGETIAEDFDWHFSESLPLPQICRRLSRLAESSGAPVLIFIDAIDEVAIPLFPQQLADFASRLAEFNGNLRLVLSVKPEEWIQFVDLRGNPSPLVKEIFAPASGHTGDALDAMVPFSVSVSHFSPRERDVAVSQYSAAYHLAPNWPYAVNEAALDPFMLRMIAETAAATKTIPANLGEIELVRRYVDAKMRRTTSQKTALLELTAVARALMETAPTKTAAPPWTHLARRPDDRDVISVAEEHARKVAGLPLTVDVAAELVAVGVLQRTHDRDGIARLAFTYDRVRDYVMAVHVLGLTSALETRAFRDASRLCFRTQLGVTALEWYLGYTSDAQWSGFVEEATERATRLLSTYEALRIQLAPDVRELVSPATSGPIGVVFSGNRMRSFVLGFYRREDLRQPAVIYDSAMSNVRDPYPENARVEERYMGSRLAMTGFWFLRNPEAYAAERMKQELAELLKEGGLVETELSLLRERVVALLRTHASAIGYVLNSERSVRRFADIFVAPELFPLDLRAARAAIQTALGVRAYKDRRRSEIYRSEIERHRASGRVPDVISYSDPFTPDEERNLRERATAAVASGHDFATEDAACRYSGDEWILLAQSIDDLLTREEVVASPTLPPPDAVDEDQLAGVHNFEDGYSDRQLALLVEHIYDSALRAYNSTLETSLGAPMAALLKLPDAPTGILCICAPLSERLHSQFGFSLETGPAFAIDPGVLDGKRAIAATVRRGLGHMNSADFSIAKAEDGSLIVHTPSGRFGIHVNRLLGMPNALWPHDAPSFVRNGPQRAARFAPIRTLIYRMSKRRLEQLSVDSLLSLGQVSSA